MATPDDKTRPAAAPKDAHADLLRDPLLRDVPTIEGFKVLEPAVLYAKIGAGGMGVVYRGRHYKLDLDVAVKCLKPSLAAEDGDFVKRFEREARLAASIAHQNVVRVMDVMEKDGLHYLVMEFVRGETASERVKRKGALSEREALAILYGATAGLGAAHARGIVHRDIKPENVMISLSGEVKLADLGLAKSTSGVDGRSISNPSANIMGTPQYMPPEQWESTDVTMAADVWALGATFFYLVAGRAGISGAGTWQAVMRRITDHDYPTLRAERPDLRPEVHALFERCVQRDPKSRFPDARSLLKALKALAVSDDEDVLEDPATGSLRTLDGTVTPPPKDTLMRIRAKVETVAAGLAADGEPVAPDDVEPRTGTQARPQAPAGNQDAIPTRPSPRGAGGSPPVPVRSRRAGWIAAAALSAVAAGAAMAWWPKDKAERPDGVVAGADMAAPPQAAATASEMPVAPAPAPPADDAEVAQKALQRGRELLPQKGQLEAAIAAFEEALQRAPALEAAKLPLAAALGRRGEQLVATDLDAALGLCVRACELAPDDALLQRQCDEVREKLASRLAQGLSVQAPADGAVVGERTVLVRGSADSPRLRAVRVALVPSNAAATPFPAASVPANLVDGVWSAVLPATRDGLHRVVVQGEDVHAIVAAAAASPVVCVDSADPVLALSQPADGATMPRRVGVAGVVQDVSGCTVSVGGVAVDVAADGSFTRELELSEGAQAIDIVATDAMGRKATLRRAITVDATPPVLRVWSMPPVTKERELVIAGTVEGLAGGSLALDEQRIEVAAVGTFTASIQLAEERAYTFDLVATDAVGNRAEERITLRRDATPPGLEWTAPATDEPVPPGRVQVAGTVSDVGPVTVTINGVPAAVDGAEWKATLDVGAADLTVDVMATDAACNAAPPLRRTLRVVVDPGPRVETSIGLVLLKIAPAAFLMGSPPSEAGRGGDETQHRVLISKPYWIGETEVTQKQWRTVMGTTPWAGMDYTTTGDTVPATFVSWTDAVAFCAKLTERERQAGRLPAGMSYTLPTEAEWELACRGSATNRSAYCFGDDAGRLGQYAVFGKPVLGGHADAVRTKQPNAYGLYDMHGNIDEWCADSADFAHGRVVTDTYRDGVVDPLSLVGALRVLRGGDWGGEPASCRAAIRDAGDPSLANDSLGFRPVLVARPPVK